MVSQLNYGELSFMVALADCIRSGYVGGQLVVTRNMLSYI